MSTFKGRHWPWRIGRGVIVGAGCLAAVQGVDATTGWLEFAHMLTPSVVLPMVVAVGTAIVPHDVLRPGDRGK